MAALSSTSSAAFITIATTFATTPLSTSQHHLSFASRTTPFAPFPISSSPPCRRSPISIPAATYRLKLITPSGEFTVDAPDDCYILESVQAAGVDVPYSCRGGCCSACAAKILEGRADQSEGFYLDDARLEQGFVLTCIAYPQSDLVIQTHAENEL